METPFLNILFVLTQSGFKTWFSQNKKFQSCLFFNFLVDVLDNTADCGSEYSVLLKCLLLFLQALYASKIISYAQGFMLLRQAAKEFGWSLNYGAIALMWRGGCIIRRCCSALFHPHNLLVLFLLYLVAKEGNFMSDFSVAQVKSLLFLLFCRNVGLFLKDGMIFPL